MQSFEPGVELRGSRGTDTGREAGREDRGRPEKVDSQERDGVPRSQETEACALQGPKAVKSLN